MKEVILLFRFLVQLVVYICNFLWYSVGCKETAKSVLLPMPAPFLIGTFLLVVGMDLISSINCAPNKLVRLTGNTKRFERSNPPSIKTKDPYCCFHVVCAILAHPRLLRGGQ